MTVRTGSRKEGGRKKPIPHAKEKVGDKTHEVKAIRGEVENTRNPDLAGRAMIPCELTIPESSRDSYLHLGKGMMLYHLFVSRGLLAHYRRAKIHNELLHDESIAYSSDKMFPESDHAPVVAEFELP